MLKYVGLELPPVKRLNVCCQSNVMQKLIPKVWTMYWNEWSPHIFTLWSWVTEDPLKSGKEHILIIVWSISWGKHTNWLCLFETPIGYRRRLKGTHLGSNPCVSNHPSYFKCFYHIVWQPRFYFYLCLGVSAELMPWRRHPSSVHPWNTFSQKPSIEARPNFVER